MGEFTDVFAQNIIKQLFDLDNKNSRDIVLIINSDGGDVSALFAIHDAMKMVGSDVATLCLGHAYSCAADLLIAGTKGKRFITPTSDIMFHEMSGKAEGSVSEIKDELVTIAHYNKMLRQMTINSLGEKHKYALRSRKDTYLNAEQSLKIGAVDHIVKNIDDMLGILNQQPSK
jgi:ATP-dependent Clp protease protease subunit